MKVLGHRLAAIADELQHHAACLSRLASSGKVAFAVGDRVAVEFEHEGDRLRVWVEPDRLAIEVRVGDEWRECPWTPGTLSTQALRAMAAQIGGGA